MTAIWCHPCMAHFGRNLAEATGWRLYIGIPTGEVDDVFIIGLYDAPRYEMTLECTKRAKRRIIHWCGSDVSAFIFPELLPEAVHTCESENLRRELLDKGIEASILEMPTKHHVDPTPLPEKPAVAFYAGSDPEKYGMSIVRFLMDCLPDVRFHIYQLGQYERMDDIIRDSTVYVRFTQHDGSATSAKEFMEAGRYVVTTAEIPYAKRVSKNDPAGILRAVRAALKSIDPNYESSDYYKGVNAAEHFMAVYKEVVA